MSDESNQQLGITVSKRQNMSEWYTQVVKKAGLASYAPVKGCMIIEPYGMKLWERIRDTFDDWISDEVDNAYFPLLIPESYLEREKDIVDGFDPEVAWVEKAGNDEELEERLAIRPTSESIIAPYMADTIQSYRDLPLRLNQWSNVVRWEATDTRPFLRTREFLWQEGHTAHASKEAADEEMYTRLDQYARLYEDIMAVPVLEGKKPEHDKFPGADMTTTVEALMPDGKSIQGGTSHNLGQSFSEAFDITYEDEQQQTQHPYTCSWGLSTRAIGALIMAHGDDDGLVLPPEVAPIEVVIVPIMTGDGTDDDVLAYGDEIEEELAGFRTEYDDDQHKTPGFKFNKWELKGVPLRIEIGPREMDDEEVTLVRRDTGEELTITIEDLTETVEEQLEDIQVALFENLKDYRDDHITRAESYEEILERIGRKRGYVTCAWCGDEQCEAEVKDQIAAEIVMVPFEDEREEIEGSCAICGEEAVEIAYFAKNY
ncbi:MAG: proline--tRNA ligase [Candidatus Nanohaloarchaeota archaeon QJJ-5]|nr:proline--tRNA ligase [Candidatus Nanohaloarchaeota archaeon QJJ-5]